MGQEEVYTLCRSQQSVAGLTHFYQSDSYAFLYQFFLLTCYQFTMIDWLFFSLSLELHTFSKDVAGIKTFFFTTLASFEVLLPENS